MAGDSADLRVRMVRTCPSRAGPDRELLAGLRDRFGPGVSPDPIRDHVEIREATASVAPWSNTPDSEAAKDYQRLAEWIETGDAVAVDPRRSRWPDRRRPDRGLARRPGTDTHGTGPNGRGLGAARISSVEWGPGPRISRRRPPGSSGEDPVPPLGHAVRIIGDLNHWQPEGVPLGVAGLSDFIGIERRSTALRYRLLVDGRQMLDPINPSVTEGPDGQPASVVMVGESPPASVPCRRHRPRRPGPRSRPDPLVRILESHRMETASNPFDELTSLYLGEVETEAEDETTAGAADASREDSDRSMVVPGRHAVTIALCGHLPVMAGLWVTRYADRRGGGRSHRPRPVGGGRYLEVLRPGAELAERIDEAQGISSSRSAAGFLGIRRWIVCVDDRDAAPVRAGADEVVI